MSVPNDRRYLKSHEWHRLEGDIVTIGITQFAADELTDITYVSLPKVGTRFSANDRFGEIESVKATSDLYTGVSGEVVAVNSELNSNPAVVNTDPFESGWMIKLRVSNPSEFDTLMDAGAYQASSGH
ncbi:MAG: glycine cleavage system H protein [Phycisphaerae bacterium]|jgi:glycine cleavage system H protein|nr:MAG: glycine cleavage system H protein [Phycisphaerae bacterium]